LQVFSVLSAHRGRRLGVIAAGEVGDDEVASQPAEFTVDGVSELAARAGRSPPLARLEPP
jgi:hypothetical protein